MRLKVSSARQTRFGLRAMNSLWTEPASRRRHKGTPWCLCAFVVKNPALQRRRAPHPGDQLQRVGRADELPVVEEVADEAESDRIAAGPIAGRNRDGGISSRRVTVVGEYGDPCCGQQVEPVVRHHLVEAGPSPITKDFAIRKCLPATQYNHF